MNETRTVRTVEARLVQPRQPNLPTQPTTLVGRGDESRMIGEILLRPEIRLVTLTGPGGVGKTRLALEVARSLASSFDGGCHLISLSPITDPTLVIIAIARGLGIQESTGGSLLDHMKSRLQGSELLLLLDNYEQVISSSPLIVELLMSCPGLKALVTSREALRIRGEHEIPVAPFALPQFQKPLDLAEIAQHDAVRLFLERAQSVAVDFRMTEENAEAICAICRRLDGLPLAIELAAARVKVLSPASILERLDNRFGFLTGGARDLPARQQTLAKAIEWSYDMLDERERSLFLNLALFAGGCTLEFCERLYTELEDPTRPLLLDLLSSLIDKSLIGRREDSHGVSRFTMLETLSAYGLEKLKESGELQRKQQAFIAIYAAYALELDERAPGMEQRVVLDLMEEEHGNFRLAVRWGTELGEFTGAINIAASIWRLWSVRGYFTEASRLHQQLAPHVGDAPPINAARFLNGAAIVALRTDRYDDAERYLEECLGLYETLDNKQGISSVLNNLAVVVDSRGDLDRAEQLIERAIGIQEGLNDTVGMSAPLANLGRLARTRGDFQRARELFEQSADIARMHGRSGGVAAALFNLSETLYYLNDYTAAHIHCKEAIAIRRQLNDRHGVVEALIHSAAIGLMRGEHSLAHPQLIEALEIGFEIDDDRGVAWGLMGLADYAIATGTMAQGVIFCRASLRRQESGSLSDDEDLSEEGDEVLASARGGLNSEEFDAAERRGESITPGELLELAKGLGGSFIPRIASAPRPQADSKEKADELGITTRELEVLQLLTEDLTDAQIGEKLFISTRTVNAHLRSIYSKLDVTSRAAAVRFSIEKGLVVPT